LINASRGEVVDEEALYKALSKESLRGPGWTCFEHEPPVGSKLLTLDNVVVVTPHIGAPDQGRHSSWLEQCWHRK
jgi:phosphoglycerate dehydrogenase-like enzyme